ncbi:MAG TPA: hypothetical protein VM142_00090 [Acidimicrobiales bacterium]|nr:hypothetical protein [Acidimicrobiales bacterium]
MAGSDFESDSHFESASVSQRGPGGLDAEAPAEPVDQQKVADLSDERLDRVQTDQLTFEPLEHLGTEGDWSPVPNGAKSS